MSTGTRANVLTTYFRGRRLRPAGLVAMVTKFLSIHRERQCLKALDSHILKDIGYSRDEADAEAKRPSWDAPSRWLR